MNDFAPIAFFASFVRNNTKIVDQTWYFDTSSSHQLTSNKTILENLVSYTSYEIVMLGMEVLYLLLLLEIAV